MTQADGGRHHDDGGRGPLAFYAWLPSSYSHGPTPYGALGAMAAAARPRWRWALGEFLPDCPPHAGAAAVCSAAPDALLSTAYLFNVERVRGLAARVHALNPAIPIVLGGPEFLGPNEDFLRATPAVRAVVRGDESALPLLLDALQAFGGPCGKEASASSLFQAVPGLCWLDDGGAYRDNGPARLDIPLDALPSPLACGAWWEDDRPFVSIEASRGCLGSCLFCCGASLGRHVRLRSIEAVAEDMRAVRRSGRRDVRLLDRALNHDESRFTALLALFAAEFADMRVHIEIDPRLLTPAGLAAMAAAPPGQLHADIGVQTLVPSVAAAAGRPFDPDRLLPALRALAALPNVETHADLLFGLPGQTSDSVFADALALVDMGMGHIQLERLKLLPGTPFRRRPPSGLAFSPQPPYEVLATDAASPADLLRLDRLSRALDSFYNHHALRPAVRVAAARGAGFLPALADALDRLHPAHGKPSLANRVRLLLDMGRAPGAGLLRNMAAFAALRAGLESEIPAEFHPSATRRNGRRELAATFQFDVESLAADPRAPERPGTWPARHSTRLGDAGAGPPSAPGGAP